MVSAALPQNLQRIFVATLLPSRGRRLGVVEGRCRCSGVAVQALPEAGALGPEEEIVMIEIE